MKEQAIRKIDAELKTYKGDQYGNAMKDYVSGALKEFAQQNEEFAQAIVQGGAFADCMKSVAGKVKGLYISDLDACKSAAEFYFPGSVVEFHMRIYTSKYEAEEQAARVVDLKLEDLI